jgi:hypothetical protein
MNLICPDCGNPKCIGNCGGQGPRRPDNEKKWR